MQVRARFHMDCQHISSCLSEGLKVAFRLLDHQVHIQHGSGFISQRTQCLHDQRTNGDVGHEMPIHHVDVEPVGPGAEGFAALVFETSKVGRQDGWREKGHD